MRSVDSTASKVTRSIASRSAQCTVTSTVLSSSLASIMRTSAGWPCRALSAASISVWPGYGSPAANSASLWIGAVAMAETSPRLASATASRMQAAASRPQRASTVPHGACASSEQRQLGSSTGSAPGGTSARSATESITAMGSSGTSARWRQTAAARRSTAGSPSTSVCPAGPVRPSRKARTMISGPMPSASPSVTTTGCVARG